MNSPINPRPITQELLIKLIKEDLKSNKLHFGLNQLDIVAEPYHSDLGSIILTLMGLPENDDDLYAFYQYQMERFTSLETATFLNQLDTLALKFYLRLLSKDS